MQAQWLDELSRHTITDVHFKSFRARYPRLHGKNAVKTYHGFGGSVLIAQITTDQGASGWGALCRSLSEARSALTLMVGRRSARCSTPRRVFCVTR